MKEAQNQHGVSITTATHWRASSHPSISFMSSSQFLTLPMINGKEFHVDITNQQYDDCMTKTAYYTLIFAFRITWWIQRKALRAASHDLWETLCMTDVCIQFLDSKFCLSRAEIEMLTGWRQTFCKYVTAVDLQLGVRESGSSVNSKEPVDDFPFGEHQQ
ncbi:hypothetical protein T11_16654 [Trichinella zimbabwensis]|uniref:Uncharacterized protein n=1 Tax=Trichinella zimbabwensis TaxID=268475 RepID=A0A0V1GS71_9BILA|nr:hypothetical protein T11_13165 [Trichinella zimbabwensis]KRZ00994.1 hypothetical protein T11_6887 [Trichinella zimbabwensis]KRZ06835.1 hypothetical protein T11_16654 [Trichinella zimbabwensis]